jgi:hypothetical protein
VLTKFEVHENESKWENEFKDKNDRAKQHKKQRKLAEIMKGKEGKEELKEG